MSEKLEKLAEMLDKLTLLEAAELSKMLQDKWGVSAAAPVAVAGMPAAAAEAAAEEEEKTEFDVVLKEIGPKKIQVIKAVRTFRADLGLREAKELVDSAPSLAESRNRFIQKAGTDSRLPGACQFSPGI